MRVSIPGAEKNLILVYELDWGSKCLYIAILKEQMPPIWWVFYRRGLVRKTYAETDPEALRG
jgi:hypothetical protein